MRTLTNRVRWMLALAITSGALLAANSAWAACVNDDDCPGTQCGGQICDYSKGFSCQPAAAPGTTKGMDGWCTTDDNCKCKGQGATCVGVYCSFTTPPTAGATGGAAGSTGGASGSTTGGASGSTGGASGTGGATSSSDAGTTPKSGSSGGCSIASATPSERLGAVIALVGLFAFGRRRRRA